MVIARRWSEVCTTSGRSPASTQQLTAADRLGAALLGQVDVDPAGEEVLGVPLALAVAEQDQGVRHAWISSVRGRGISADGSRSRRSPRPGAAHRRGLDVAVVVHDRDLDDDVLAVVEAEADLDEVAGLELAGDLDVGRRLGEVDQRPGRDLDGLELGRRHVAALGRAELGERRRLRGRVVGERRDEGARAGLGGHDHGAQHVDGAVAVVGAVGGRVVPVGRVVEPARRQGRRGEGERRRR